MYENNILYNKCDRYKRYLDGLRMQLLLKSIGGRYTKVYRELREKFDKAYKKWEEMCNEAYKKQKLESIGISTTPQRDIELYKEIYKKGKNKKTKY